MTDDGRVAFSARRRERRGAVDVAVARAVGTACVASLIVTTAVAFRTPDELTATLGHPLVLRESEALVTGLWAADLLVLQVVFLARLPWLERAWGRDRLTRLHRLAGLWSFWLTVTHVLLFVIQRSGRDRAHPAAAMRELFLTGPWLLPATIGTALLVLVVVTSTVDVRRRLRYETWHLLHLWAYAGILLALPHQLASGDLRGGWATGWWWGLYLVGLAALLGGRVALPVWQSARAGLRVVEVTPAGGDAVTVTMEGRGLRRFATQPGQFFVWRFLGGRGGSRGHPYSLSAAPTDDRLRVTVDGSGDGAVRLRALPVGGRVLVEGPYGAFTLAHRRHERLAFVVAGVGVTPVLSLLGGGGIRAGEATVVHRVSTATDAVLLTELEEACAATGSTLLTLPGPRGEPGSWLPRDDTRDARDAIADLLPDVAGSDVYLCGPPAWARAAARDLRAAGVRRRDLHREDFSW